jgi:hypothetical protein
MTRSWSKFIMLSGLLLLSPYSASAASSDRFVRAELFFIPWSVLTRSQLSPEQVRRHPHISMRIEDHHYVSEVVGWLGVDRLAKSESDDGDARLVIDFFDDAGKRTTFYADRFNLMSENGVRRRPIDQRFRQAICSGIMLNEVLHNDRCSQ